MNTDDLVEGQTGPLKCPYLGYYHVEFVEYVFRMSGCGFLPDLRSACMMMRLCGTDILVYKR